MAGLLNFLVVLDACGIALGRKSPPASAPPMTSHFLLLVMFAFFVWLVFGVLRRDDPREQLRTGAMMFGGFIATAIVLGWLMYPFPL